MIYIAGIAVDPEKLFSRQELLDLLFNEGETDCTLSKVRERYHEDFGNELVWRYPYSDGMHAGLVIVTVQEGFISLPYDYVDKEVYEIFELDETAMFDVESLECFIDDYKSISDDLLGAMGDMLTILRNGGAAHEK